MKKEKDYRSGQKVIATLKLSDQGQDFTELDILENGVVVGNSIMFSYGRLSLLGVGSLDGSPYFSFEEFKKLKKSYTGLFIYLKDTKEKVSPLPWKAKTLNYKIIGMAKVIKPNRFIQ